jgi:hypothetical protein
LRAAQRDRFAMNRAVARRLLPRRDEDHEHGDHGDHGDHVAQG